MCGGKVIKIGWQSAKSLWNKIGAKLSSTLQSSRQVVGVGNIRATTTPEINLNNLNTDFYTARGIKYAGKNHEVTGIPFTKDGYPIFDSYVKADVKITGDLANMRPDAHKSAAPKELWKLINEGKVDRNIFTTDESLNIKNGKPKISEAYTWHHHQEVGRMQLVPYEIHKKSGHNGGNLIWGWGSKRHGK